jgi:tRNA uridine 5-carboxymethylaminomethyl modification enzyme
MFTSRAEFRTLLRQDNADLRLTEMSYRMGLASQARMDQVIEKKQNVARVMQILSQVSVEPEEINKYLLDQGSSLLLNKQKVSQLLLRPNVDLAQIINHVSTVEGLLKGFTPEELEQAEIQLKYSVYIGKEKDLVERMSQMENLAIPDNFNYDKLSAISNEALQKFKKIKPRTLGQASRISGVNPSDVQILMVYMGR